MRCSIHKQLAMLSQIICVKIVFRSHKNKNHKKQLMRNTQRHSPNRYLRGNDIPSVRIPRHGYARNFASNETSAKTRKHAVLSIVIIAMFFVVFGGLELFSNHASSATPQIKSGSSGYCIEASSKTDAIGSSVNISPCSSADAQNWGVNGSYITHDSKYCLSVEADGTTAGNKTVLNQCSDASGQVWLSDNGGYYNPNSEMCLSTPAGKTSGQLIINSCKYLSNNSETWTPQSSADSDTNNSNKVSCANDTKGEKIACYAEKEWTAWQSPSSNHENILNNYTDGNAYEEWCADFVSYVYQEAGYPFTQGERSGWDEYDANNIQNQGFTIHTNSNYIPQPGDVAFFDYPGGHVEIVVSGGKNPTFVYGDSATIDPSTGNGEMEANTIRGDSEGQVIYYMSPN
jgi:hypothetical protein